MSNKRVAASLFLNCQAAAESWDSIPPPQFKAERGSRSTFLVCGLDKEW